MKVDKSDNKRGVSKNASCLARIRITIEMTRRRHWTTEFMKVRFDFSVHLCQTCWLIHYFTDFSSDKLCAVIRI